MFEQLLTQLLQELIQEIIAASRAAGQEASGRTYEQITEDVHTQGDTTIGEVWAPGYFNTLIRGRGPGPIPMDMEQIIMDWAGYKGLTFQSIEDLNRFARAVAWTIRRDGSELYRNHLYVDIVDTPVRNFEEKLGRAIFDSLEVAVTKSFGAEGYPGHGYIL